MTLTAARMHQLERAGLLTALAILTLLAWWYLVARSGMSGMTADRGTLATLSINTVMWAVMMVAMMIPSASPMILIYARVHQSTAGNPVAAAPTWVFMTGYLAVWMAFATAVAVAQWALYQYGALSSAMGSLGPMSGGVLLILAGAFQFTGLKQACLEKCRSPVSFLMTEWRPGYRGALVMGLRHGAFCTGCCWALMLLMFTGGVMSLGWMAALAAYFLVEKWLPFSRQAGFLTGALLIIAGVAMATGWLSLLQGPS